jgi:hypothetical protein
MYNSVLTRKQKINSGIHFIGVSLLFFICFLVIDNTHLMAQGNLMIAPHRIVFEGQKRVMDVTLANTGQDSAKYSISFLQYRVNDDGGYEDVKTPDPGQKFADQNIRFFPRTVMLGPNEAQVVKLQLIKSDQLEPGEYRSHIYFRAIPNQKVLGEAENKKDSSGFSIKIVPIFGISIPVIIRVGESTTILNITDIKLITAADGTKKLLLSIHRTGNMSSLGDVTISYIAPNGKATKIGLEEGVAVYTPNLLRRLEVALDNNSSVDLSKGKIHVAYTSQSETRTVKLAEADLAL